jgi:AmmeMemoRadiSam system protein B
MNLTKPGGERMSTTTSVRPSPIAGRWYEGDPKKLAENIDRFLTGASLPKLEGELVGVIAPHAGHIYSGETAGYAFATVKEKHFSLVAIFSPLHNYHFAPVLTTAHDAYQTPLGEIAVAGEILDKVETKLRAEGIELSRIAFDQEHSLEIELPFLQRALQGDFKLLPFMVRSNEPKILKSLAVAVSDAVGNESCLLVGSTDLSHFHSEEHAQELDEVTLAQIGDFSPEGVLMAERTGKGAACGAGAVAAVMWAAKRRGATHAIVLHHSTSGKTTRDFDSVVGYGAAAILR